jgi:hypothetical protein
VPIPTIPAGDDRAVKGVPLRRPPAALDRPPWSAVAGVVPCHEVGKHKHSRGGRYTPPAVACLLCSEKVRNGERFIAMQIGVPGAYEPGIAHVRCASVAAAYVEADGGSVVSEPLTPELLDEVFG